MMLHCRSLENRQLEPEETDNGNQLIEQRPITERYCCELKNM